MIAANLFFNFHFNESSHRSGTILSFILGLLIGFERCRFQNRHCKFILSFNLPPKTAEIRKQKTKSARWVRKKELLEIDFRHQINLDEKREREIECSTAKPVIKLMKEWIFECNEKMNEWIKVFRLPASCSISFQISFPLKSWNWRREKEKRYLERN